MLISTVVIPLLLGGIQLALRSPDLIFGEGIFRSLKTRVIYSTLALLLTPIQIFILYTKLYFTDLNLKAYQDDKMLLAKRERLTYELKSFVKLELGIESLYQLILQFIFLLMAKTDTPTNLISDTLRNIQNNDDLIELLVLSLLWSFATNILSNNQGLSTRRVFFPIKSQIMAGLYTLFVSSSRILAMVLYFTPMLGLFGLLKHYKAEQTKWDTWIEHAFVENNTIRVGNVTVKWSEINRWNGNEAPSYELYTIFSIGMYFFAFIALHVLQFAIILIMKLKISQPFRQLNFIEKFIHLIESLNIPGCVEEWDTQKGNARDHYHRMKSNKTEGLIVISINGIFNLLFLTPLGILGTIIYLSHIINSKYVMIFFSLQNS